jgi:ribosomal protein S18 acetylase RimI-like enzyme
MRSSSLLRRSATPPTLDELAWCKHPAMAGNAITYRQLVAADLARIGEIDRTERIETLYVQHGARLEERTGDWSAPRWFSNGPGEHSVAHPRAECERHLAAGGIALGAFAEGRLVGIGIVTPHIRPGVAQLAFLHVSNEYRAQGIGGHLTGTLERFAREHGHTTIGLGHAVPQHRSLLPRARLRVDVGAAAGAV